MTAKEFVLSHRPKARESKHQSGVKGFNLSIWYVITDTEKRQKLGDGTTPAKAWKDAKELIIEILKDKE